MFEMRCSIVLGLVERSVDPVSYVLSGYIASECEENEGTRSRPVDMTTGISTTLAARARTLLVTTDLEPHVADLLTRWTVRLAIACYIGRVALDLRRLGTIDSNRVGQTARWLWTVGGAFYLAHVLCAFSFVHDWNHGHALKHTAAQTKELTGVDWGGGLYLNYAFTLFWLGDIVVWWFGDVNAHCRGRGYFWTLHGVFAFMVFNATVVFGPPVWRWVAPLVGVALAIVYFRSTAHRRRVA